MQDPLMKSTEAMGRALRMLADAVEAGDWPDARDACRNLMSHTGQLFGRLTVLAELREGGFGAAAVDRAIAKGDPRPERKGKKPTA